MRIIIKQLIEVKSSDLDLYYYCANHKGMGGEITTNLPIISENEKFSVSEDAELGGKLLLLHLKVRLKAITLFNYTKQHQVLT